MSGVHAAKSFSAERLGEPLRAADIQAMQDVLYDILANGVDPDRADIPTQEVERFLFEHARSPKSREEFCAFFAKHGLSVTAQPAPAPIPLSLPPLERVEPRGMPARLPVELSVLAQNTAEPWPAEEVEALRPRRPARLGLWAGVACAAVLVSGLFAYGYVLVRDLQTELSRTAQDNRENQRALEALRDRAAGLESSVAATGELVQRMDQKSDLIVESLAATQAQDERKPRKRGGR